MKARTLCRTALVRSISALVAIAAFLPLRMAASAPGDIFTTAAPAIGDAPPAASALADGESGVSTNTGAFTYSYPIEAPPGRNGMKPNLSLSYSSQAPIYGGLAAGWTVSGLPIIIEDTSGGRLWSSGTQQRFQSSLAGNRPLVEVAEPAPATAITYRAQNDSSWMRYERYASAEYWWRALSPDGTKYFFGHKDSSHISNCTVVSAGYAPITRIEDSLGNQVDFFYQAGVDGECRPLAVVWGQNTVTGAGAFAAILFTYESTPPSCNNMYVGAQTSYRTGTKIVTGASKLTTIKSIAVEPSTGSPGGIAPPPVTPPVHTRTITLAYESATESCTAAHAPYRALKSIQESAVGVDSPLVNLPPIEFAYANASMEYTTQLPSQVPVPWANSALGGPNPGVFNLGWGHRPNNGWPTVEAMMLDIDGDGLIDRVQSEPMLDGAGNVQFCRARWYRNRGPAPQGSDQFQLAGDIDMPTLKWSSPGGSGFTGGAYARQDTIYGVHERCALNYQRTAYRNSTVGFLSRCSPGGEPCPDGADGVMDGIGVCLGTHSDCGINKSTSAETHFAWRWMDVDGDQLPDLIGSPITGGVGSYDLQRGNANPFPPPSEPLIFGSFPQCPSPSYTGSTNWNADQYTMCHGMFPWFIYKNHGKGVFGQARGGGSGLTHGTWGPLPDQIVYQPVPLESANGDSSVTSKPVGQFDATVDIDGDGFVDAIKVFDYPANQWKVYRNDGTGRMVASSGTSQFVFETNFYLFPSRTDYTPSPNPTPAGVEGLLDLNGDGLVDQWRSLSGDPSQATVHYNDGVRFRATGALPVSDRLGPDGYPVVSSATGTPLHYVCAGTRTDSRRTHDIDQDGRADLIRFNTGSTIPTTRFNFGGRFGGPALQLGFGAAHTIQVRSDNDNNPCEGAGWWETLGDLIDLDGDGVEEDVHFTSISGPPNQMQVRYGTSVPRRLMVSVKNGRGATTSISYSSMNGPAVTQSPAEGNTSPSTNWVVQSVATTDDFPSTTSTSTYKYKNPQWSPDQDADVPTAHSFRGFEQVETTSPSGAVTIERFSYSPDWSGRLATRIIKPSSGTIVHTIDDTTWEAFTLFNGLITTYLATATEHWTCTSTQTEKTCRTNVDTYTRTATQFSPLKSTSTTEQTTLMWQPTTTLLQAALAPAMSDRGTVTTYALYSDASSYRLRPLTVTKNVILPGGTFAMYAKSASTWDAARGLKLTDEEWIDNSDATRLITTNTYDAIGNLIAVQDPRGHTVENEYDSRQLFVSAVNNEYYDHHYEYDYEYGTGATLATRGPLWAWCATYQTPFCPSPPPPGFMVRNETRHRVDGLGRVIAKFESVNNDFNLYDYKLKQTEIHSYVDAATSTTPTSATHQTAIDETGVQIRYRSETTQFDGHGRPIKTTVAAPIAHVTAYSYRADGTLQSVSVPDPTKNDASLVTYTYGFDTVGRPTSIRRPDSTTAANQSGVNIAYNGLTSTTTEVVGSAGGKTGETQTINDRFGRLQFVKEKTGTNIYATTTYSYDAADNVATIVDPQGVTTTLVHDLAGRRTDITRAGRTWHYGYDGNDNLTSVRTPCTGLACAKYVTTYNYDPLNRETTRIIAPRELSTPDRELFVADSELRFWDYGANARDRVAQWFSYAPSSTETRLLNWFNYDPRGSVLMQTQRFKNAGLPLMTRDVMHDYHLSGLPYITRYREQNGEWPVKRTSYDGRGLTSSIEVSFDRGVTYPNQPTVQTRNVAGLVTKRRTNVTSGPMSFVESNWTYDKLGRVTNQTVQKSGPTQVARQALTYFGNDDVKTLQHFLGATSRTFSYTYDLRHQITGAIENDASYFKGGYQYGAAGRLTRVRHDRTATPPGADPRLVRYVNYVYGGTDPEQVTALTNVSNGSTYATYTYDDAGNQTTRAYPATNELFEYTYDGQDQLRRVVRKVSGVVQGSEEYWYGMDGNRTQVLKRDAAGNKTELIWFIEDVEAHYQVNVDGTTTLTKTYAHVSDGTPIARIERTGPDPATNKIEYQFHGLANNTLAAVAQNGTINASFSYAPFGELLESTNAGGSTQGTTAHKRRSNDKYEDDLGALTYYGARYYDKTLIGWTQSDPLYRFAPDSGWVKPRAANLYMFSLNNSSRYIDPDGQQAAELAGDLLKVGAGAATASTAGGGALATATAVAGPGLIVAGGMVMTMKALAPESGPGISIKHEGAYDQAAIQANNRAQAEARARSEQAFADNMAAFEEGVAQTTGRDTLEKDGGPAGRTAPNNAWQKPASKPGYVGNLAKPPRGRGSTPQGQRDKKRGYTSKERAAKRKEQKGKCATGCGTDIDENNSEGHHTTRHADGTPTDDAHHAEVCKDCHKELHRPD